MRYFDDHGHYTAAGINAENEIYTAVAKIFRDADAEDLPHIYALVVGAAMDLVSARRLGVPRAEPDLDTIRQGMKL
jgi:hypothetical protein